MIPVGHFPRRRWPLVASISLIAGIALAEVPELASSAIDLGARFEGRPGCFLLQPLPGTPGESMRWGTFCETRLSPCSTFKLPNALGALDLKVIESERHIFRWDGTPRRLERWNKDMDLREAMTLSCVPCFQELARKTGAVRMQAALDRWDYGNRDISSGLDNFWLSGSLEISPLEQLAFVRRLWEGSLPVGRPALDAVRAMVVFERGAGWSFSGKTGSCGTRSPESIPHGWYVGAVERDGRRAVFATLIQGPGCDGMLAREITRQILVETGWLPSP